MTTSIDAQSRLPPISSIFRTLESFMAEPVSHTRLLASLSPSEVSRVITSGEEPSLATPMTEGSPITADIQTTVNAGTNIVTSVTSVSTTGSLRDPVFPTTSARLHVEAQTSLSEGSPATPTIGVTAGTTTAALESTTVVLTVPIRETGSHPFVSHAQLEAVLRYGQEELYRPPPSTFDARRCPLLISRKY